MRPARFTVLFLACCACGALAFADETLIAILKSREAAPYGNALAGFKTELRRRNIKANFVEYDLRESELEGKKAVDDLKQRKADLIFTLGSLATDAAKKNVKTTPIVFSMVLNPVDNGFAASMESCGGNVAGACIDIPAREQFRHLKEVVPGMRKVGVLFNPNETAGAVKQAGAAARELGLEFFAKAVTSEKEVPQALEEIKDRIDVLWAVPDGTVFNSITTKYFILFTLRNRIPFMGISSSFVKAGALTALFPDDEDVGRQSGEIAARILNGESPASIPVAVPRKTNISLNLKVAENIKAEVPSRIVNNAKEVFK